MINDADLIRLALREMFSAVGLKGWSDGRIERYCKRARWWTLHKWSMEQEEKFKDWLVTAIRTRSRMPKKWAEKAAAWFLLDYGWMTK